MNPTTSRSSSLDGLAWHIKHSVRCESNVRGVKRTAVSLRLRCYKPIRPQHSVQCKLSCTSSLSDALQPVSDEAQPLREWIEAHGGYIHPALTLSQSPTFGCRAVVTTEDIDEELVSREPLLLVPEELSMSTNLAKQQLGPLLKAAKLPDLEGLDAVLPLALFIAHERGKGKGSFWQPYLGLLPENPGCAWLMGPEELQQALQTAREQLGSQAEDWGTAVQEAKSSVTFQAQAMAKAYGKTLNVTADGILWAMGQVLSRCFGQEPDLAMLPFTDLCNHSSHAMAPNSYTGADDGRPFVFVSSVWDDTPRPLKAGDEVFISYMANTPPVTALLNLGFVPEELTAQSLQATAVS